jgi:hypothetical protein
VSCAQAINEVEAWPRDGHDDALLSVAVGEGVFHDVGVSDLVLNAEVEAEKLANTVMLRDRGEALVQQEFQAVVIRTYDEWPPREIRQPVLD